MKNYTYLLQCADNTLYCGWTNHLEERVWAHNQGKGAKYTRGRRPVVLAYYEVFETKEEAMKREAAIKRMSRREKEELIGRMQPGGAAVSGRQAGQAVKQPPGGEAGAAV